MTANFSIRRLQRPDVPVASAQIEYICMIIFNISFSDNRQLPDKPLAFGFVTQIASQNLQCDIYR